MKIPASRWWWWWCIGGSVPPRAVGGPVYLLLGCVTYLCCLEVTPPSDYFPSSVTITNTPLAWGGFSYTEASSPTQSLTWMPGAIVLLTLV